MVHWDMINRMAVRRFCSTSLAEEAPLFVLNKLAEINWQRLEKFSGTSSFRTYLASLTFRLMEDFAREKFGRKQAPLWIKKLGGIWLKLFRLLCLERFNIRDAVEYLAADTHGEHKETIEEKGYQILENVTDCGGHQAKEVSTDDEQLVVENDCPESDQQERLEKEERKLIFKTLFHKVLGTEVERTIHDSFEKVMMSGIRLKAEERLLLKMCYQDGLNITVAGRLLGYNRNQVHGRMRRLLRRLRCEFEKIGIDKELLLLLEGE